jgi:hypothetical protein
VDEIMNHAHHQLDIHIEYTGPYAFCFASFETRVLCADPEIYRRLHYMASCLAPRASCRLPAAKLTSWESDKSRIHSLACHSWHFPPPSTERPSHGSRFDFGAPPVVTS